MNVSIAAAAALSHSEIEDAFLRTLYHELPHILRWDGPGYGETLGEAIITEGLAQHFLHEMMECPAEPWEEALPQSGVRTVAVRAMAEFQSPGYDHAAWFFGAGELPQWAGYCLGASIVGNYIARHPGTTAFGLAHTPASEFHASLQSLARGHNPMANNNP